MVPDVVVVLAKCPVAGRVKTRLQPTFSAAEAAALAAAAIRDTLDAVAGLRARHTVLAWEGSLPGWLPRGVPVVSQRGSGLDERLEHVFADVYAGVGNRRASVLLVGMDTPQLTVHDLDTEWDGDAVLGPACDGGYWAIGFRRHVPGAIEGVPMSTARTGAQQRDRLVSLGLRVGLLPVMRDVDVAEDAAAVARVAPDTRFGRLHRRIVDTPCAPTTLFDAALCGASVEVRVEHSRQTGYVRSGAVDTAAWSRLSAADEVVVSRCEGPVLDLGCGPGRFVEALAGRGVPALGVDLSREAVVQTRLRGACALVRDVHERLPGEGRWGTVLLADGNIGIGGDPFALLRRCRDVLRPGALALVEASPEPSHDVRTTVTLHGPGGRRSIPVPWAVLGTPALVRVAAAAGFVAVEDWRVGGRAFVMLRQAG